VIKAYELQEKYGENHMRILVVDDLDDARQVLRYMVENNSHEEIEASNGLDALRIVKSSPPDLIISDALMPAMDEFQFLRAIKQDPVLCAIPFVHCSSAFKEDQDVRLAMSLGANTCLFKPMDPDELRDEICHTKDKELFENCGTQQYDIQVKDMHGKLYDIVLNKAVLTDSKGAVSGLVGTILDITERRLAEKEIRKLNQEPELRVRERTIELSERNAELNMEIHERKQAMEELRNAKAQLEEANRLLESLSVTDPLTGLANRRRFEEVLAKEFVRHVRSGTELSLVMLDINHFKAYNDSYGHVSGDVCLRQIAKVIARRAVRVADIAASYGKE
jgi:PleD family two-component response regulator